MFFGNRVLACSKEYIFLFLFRLEMLILGTHLFNQRLKLSYLGNMFLVFVDELFVFSVELVELDHSLNCFALGLGHTRASCPDNLQVLGADYNLVIVPAIYSLFLLSSYEVDGETLGIVSLALFLRLTKQD